MPLVFDDNATFKIVLATDQDKKDPPAFIYRHLTGRDWRKVAAYNDSIEEAKGGNEVADIVYTAIQTNLCGWENMAGMPFEPEKLEEFLTPFEAIEILKKMIEPARSLTFEDKKKLD